MPNFKYKARDKYGKAVNGSMGGASDKEVARRLREMGYTPVSIDVAVELSGMKFLERFKGVKLSELNMFTRQLVTLQKAGLPILSSLEAVGEQTGSPKLRKVIEEVIRDVEGGNSLSDAVERHPKVFNELYIHMIRAAEATGTLDQVLGRLADLGEAELSTRTQIKSAMRYPTIAFATLCIAFLVVVTFVIPRFATLFAQFDVVLPLPTRVLILTNIIIRNYWYLALLVIGSAVFAFKRFIGTIHGRAAWDNFRLKVPVFGPLLFKIAMSRFAKMTSMMLTSGIPIVQTLDMVSRTVGNVTLSRAIESIKESATQGSNLNEPMKASKMFSPIVVRMVAVGEETGKIDDLLLSVSEYYEEQIKYTVKNMTTMIEPIFIFILGIMVLIMALGIFLPMWNLLRVFRGG